MNKVVPIRKQPELHDEAEWWGSSSYYGWIIAKRVLQLSTLSQRELARHNVERIMGKKK